MRRAVAGLFLLLILCTGGWLVAQVLRPEALATGGAMPSLTYQASGAAATLRPSATTPTAVLLFHSKCSHCHYQLDQLDRELEKLGDARLYLFTTEDSLPAGEMRTRWKRLAAAPNVVWGTVRAADFEREFGVLSTPVTFAFGPEGRLLERIIGEARVDYLAAALRG